VGCQDLKNETVPSGRPHYIPENIASNSHSPAPAGQYVITLGCSTAKPKDKSDTKNSRRTVRLVWRSGQIWGEESLGMNSSHHPNIKSQMVNYVPELCHSTFIDGPPLFYSEIHPTLSVRREWWIQSLPRVKTRGYMRSTPTELVYLPKSWFTIQSVHHSSIHWSFINHNTVYGLRCTKTQ